jgi:hypothetical protein
MEEHYDQHVLAAYKAAILKYNYQKQRLAELNAIDDGKLRYLLGRHLVEGLRDPILRGAAEHILPQLKGRPAANLKAALEATKDAQPKGSGHLSAATPTSLLS